MSFLIDQNQQVHQSTSFSSVFMSARNVINQTNPIKFTQLLGNCFKLTLIGVLTRDQSHLTFPQLHRGPSIIHAKVIFIHRPTHHHRTGKQPVSHWERVFVAGVRVSTIALGRWQQHWKYINNMSRCREDIQYLLEIQYEYLPSLPRIIFLLFAFLLNEWI